MGFITIKNDSVIIFRTPFSRAKYNSKTVENNITNPLCKTQWFEHSLFRNLLTMTYVLAFIKISINYFRIPKPFLKVRVLFIDVGYKKLIQKKKEFCPPYLSGFIFHPSFFCKTENKNYHRSNLLYTYLPDFSSYLFAANWSNISIRSHQTIVTNGSPPLRHFFKRSCVSRVQCLVDGHRKLVTHFGVIQLA